MTIFAVTYRYSNDVTTRDNLRTEHRDYLRGLADQGLLLVSGPFGHDEALGAPLLFRANDKTQINALLENDPFTPSGVIAKTHTTETSLRRSARMRNSGASSTIRSEASPAPIGALRFAQ